MQAHTNARAHTHTTHTLFTSRRAQYSREEASSPEGAGAPTEHVVVVCDVAGPEQADQRVRRCLNVLSAYIGEFQKVRAVIFCSPLSIGFFVLSAYICDFQKVPQPFKPFLAQLVFSAAREHVNSYSYWFVCLQAHRQTPNRTDPNSHTYTYKHARARAHTHPPAHTRARPLPNQTEVQA